MRLTAALLTNSVAATRQQQHARQGHCLRQTDSDRQTDGRTDRQTLTDRPLTPQATLRFFEERCAAVASDAAALVAAAASDAAVAIAGQDSLNFS